MTIEYVHDPDEKTAITLKIMHSLPAWFSPPEDIDKKAISKNGVYSARSVYNILERRKSVFVYGKAHWRV